MGVQQMKAAFNDAAAPKFAAQVALQRYERDVTEDGKPVEWQVLVFRGTAADGTPFEVVSDRHAPNDDPDLVAREVATKLLAQAEKTP